VGDACFVCAVLYGVLRGYRFPDATANVAKVKAALAVPRYVSSVVDMKDLSLVRSLFENGSGAHRHPR
jgi:hypothetical protein